MYTYANTDERMEKAFQMARDTFRFYWREMSWEYRRIIPAHDLSCVKVAFVTPENNEGTPSHEHLWVSNINFDGETIVGELLNDSIYTPTLKKGDHIEATLDDVSDWLFACEGRVFGAFTVNVMRQDMSSEELASHDDEWALNFGDPYEYEVAYSGSNDNTRYINRFDSDAQIQAPDEHPMCIAMLPQLKELLESNTEEITGADEMGWTFAHNEALAGNFSALDLMKQYGVDTNVKNHDGNTPMDLAKKLGWVKEATE